MPDIEFESYWTLLTVEPEEYHDHGTSEQFHSELKTDLDLEPVWKVRHKRFNFTSRMLDL